VHGELYFNINIFSKVPNAKMNEFQSLMGEMVLKHMPKIIDGRKAIHEWYKDRLHNIPGIKLPPSLPTDVIYNYAYMPIEVDEKKFGTSRDRLYEELKKYNVFARRYFYPLLNDFACYQAVSITDPLMVARVVAGRIMTLPIYSNLTEEDVNQICEIISDIRKRSCIK
jgi:dTDP-4-amino-4,6-dideoxygalactose transaminase